MRSDQSTNVQRKGTLISGTPLEHLWKTSRRYLEHLWKTSGTPLEHVATFGNRYRDLCSTSVAPLEPPLQRCSRGRTEVHPISCRYLDFQRCSKVPFLCTFVLRSLCTGVLPPHWAFGVSMTHGRCHVGCRRPTHALGTPRRRQTQIPARKHQKHFPHPK